MLTHSFPTIGFVLVCLECSNGVSQIVWFVNNRNLFSQFCRLEVWDLGANMAEGHLLGCWLPTSCCVLTLLEGWGISLGPLLLSYECRSSLNHLWKAPFPNTINLSIWILEKHFQAYCSIFLNCWTEERIRIVIY